jgi:long-subunit fatty acid transport protein
VLTNFEGTAIVDGRRTVSLAIDGLDPTLQNIFTSTLPDGGRNGYVSNFKIKIEGVRTPQTARASVAFWPLPNVLVGGEVAWYEWMRCLNPTATLSSGSNRDLNFMIGSPQVVSKIHVNWSNEWVYSLYGSVGVTEDITLRAGFNYGGIPMNRNFLGNAPNAALTSLNLSAGAGYRILEGLEVSGLLEVSPYCSVHSGGEPSDASARFAKYSARQFLFHLGVGYAF